jgi:pimeloyl-ACP methyl ester carboxylesterase
VPFLQTNGVGLYYEVTGDGFPIVFSHEFGGGYRSWTPQVRYFDRWYRCVTYNHRGFPPSSVPQDQDAYSQDLLIDDLLGLLDQLEIGQAHLVGLSMGGNVVLNLALRRPERCRSIVVAGTGSGTVNHEQFVRDIDRTSTLMLEQGMPAFVDQYAAGPARIRFLSKDPHGYQEFVEQLREHSAVGSALTQRGVMARRPTIFALEERLERLRVPALIVVGDEDEPCVEPALFMRRHIPEAGLLVLPHTGHAVNLEEPAAFNQALRDFFDLVERDRWWSGGAGATTARP